jgi:hypothetical protein
VSEERLQELRQNGQRNSGRALADLNTAYFFYPPPGADLGVVLDQLNALPIVESAQPVPLPAPSPVFTNNFEPQQIYLNAAEANGIDAVYAWTLGGGNGYDVKVVDIEYAWNLNHSDISASLIGAAPVPPTNEYAAGVGNHGTAVLGEMGGINESLGVKGIAWGSTFYVAAANTVSGYNIPSAITTATSILRPGDIIVIEQQLDGPAAGTNDYVPVEWSQSVYDAIVTAVDNGAIVVEAAGNGAQNLDGPLFNSGHRPFAPENDSGAIIVGAGAASGVTNRSRLSFSSYGSAVDLQGWGESVVTSGYGDLWAADGTNRLYTKFSGTSSATPIVAGACAALQGIYRAQHGGIQTLGPGEMRAILQSTGVFQTGNAATNNIGPLPNLPGAISLAQAVSRIWVDFAYTGSVEAGTPERPVKTLPFAITAVLTNGSVIMKGGLTPWTGTITKPLTLRAYVGSATIGQ